MGHLRPPFLYFRLSFLQTVKSKYVQYSCRGLDSNPGPLVSEANALPTAPQPLPSTFLFLYGPTPASFFIFWSFQTNINTIFTTNQCEKMSIPSSIWCQDSNPWSLDHESSPITTRPGLHQHFLFLLKYSPKSVYRRRARLPNIKGIGIVSRP